MSRGVWSLTALLAAAAIAGCAPSTGSGNTPGAAPGPAASRDSATMHEAARAFSAAYVRGDARAMAEAYTDDAVIFPEGTPAIEGREAIERYWTLGPGRRITHHRITPTRIEVVGNTAYDHGVFEVSGTNDGEAWGPGHGKYVVVWKRGSDGRWRMQLDIWNRSPAPAAGN